MGNGYRWVFKRINIVSAFNTWRMVADNIGDMLELTRRVNDKKY